MRFYISDDDANDCFPIEEGLVFSFDLGRYLKEDKFYAKSIGGGKEHIISNWDDKLYTLLGPETIEDSVFLDSIYNEVKKSEYFIFGNLHNYRDGVYDSFLLDKELDENRNIRNSLSQLSFDKRHFITHFLMKMMIEEFGLDIGLIRITHSHHVRNKGIVSTWFVETRDSEESKETLIFTEYSDALEYIYNYMEECNARK